MKCNAEIAAAKVASMFEGMGVPLEADAFDGMQLEAKAAFAKNSNGYDNALAQDTALRHRNDVDTIASGNLQKLFGSERGSFLTLSKDPGVILGEDFIRPLTDALQEHREEFPEGSSHEAIAAYKEDVLPVIKELKGKIQTQFSDIGQVNFANRYFQAWENGGSFYNTGSDIAHHSNFLARTTVNNLVSNNTGIAFLNIFEFMPKALGVYGPEATLKGMINFSKQAGPNIFRRIPELESRAVYDRAHKGLFGNFDLINLTENPLRGLSYHVAEAAGKEGLEGVQKIAFKYRPGREPLMLAEKSSAFKVALMRYGIESAKMYGEWWRNIFTGSVPDRVQAAGSLAAFHGMIALQTGIPSSIPGPIWGLMSPEQKDWWNELDDSLPTNAVKKLTGHGVKPERAQPVTGIAFSVGDEIVNQNFKTAYQSTRKGLEEAEEGEHVRAGVDFAKAIMSGGQTFIPNLNTSARKVGNIIFDTITGDLEPEDIPAEAGEKFLGLDTKGE